MQLAIIFYDFLTQINGLGAVSELEIVSLDAAKIEHGEKFGSFANLSEAK